MPVSVACAWGRRLLPKPEAHHATVVSTVPLWAPRRHRRTGQQGRVPRDTARPESMERVRRRLPACRSGSTFSLRRPGPSTTLRSLPSTSPTFARSSITRTKPIPRTRPYDSVWPVWGWPECRPPDRKLEWTPRRRRRTRLPEEVGRRDVKGVGEGNDVVHADVSLASLHATYIVSMKPGVLGEVFLRPT